MIVTIVTFKYVPHLFVIVNGGYDDWRLHGKRVMMIIVIFKYIALWKTSVTWKRWWKFTWQMYDCNDNHVQSYCSLPSRPVKWIRWLKITSLVDDCNQNHVQGYYSLSWLSMSSIKLLMITWKVYHSNHSHVEVYLSMGSKCMR